MRISILLALTLFCVPLLSGCTIARQLTTKRLDFDQNIIPERNSGRPYDAASDTDGPIGPIEGDIVITGEVRDKYDRYHGGVDYAYLTYRVTNSANAPVRVRLWVTLAPSIQACPPHTEMATQILDVTIPAQSTITFTREQGSNIEALRRVVEALLQSPATAAACVYVQADCDDPDGTVRIHELTVVGRARGSLF
jgi:hypothetical protein